MKEEDGEQDYLPDIRFSHSWITDYWGEPLIITNFSDTYSIDLFTAGVVRFRNWMNSIGERDKAFMDNRIWQFISTD